MKLTKILKIVIVVLVSLLIVVLGSLGFWLYNNTSLFTTKIPQEELNQNNLNQPSAAIELQTINIQGKKLNIPKGFELNVFAEDVGSARFFSFSPSDAIFLGTKENDKIFAIKDTNQDGRADNINVIDSGLNSPHSVFYHDGNLYLGEENRVSVYRDINDDGSYSSKQIIIDNLPSGNKLTGGGHKTRTVVVGPDEKLYVSIGSSCNVCIEDDARRATIMRYNLDGSGGEIFATGLRNTVGFDFSESGELWGVDMGRDQIGDDIPPEELNIIEEGQDYGWPYCYGSNIANPEFPERQEYCQTQTETPLFNMQAHSAPLDMKFVSNTAKANWPVEYQDGVLIAFHGSWNRTIPTGYKVVWVDTSAERPKLYNFLTGWLESNADAWGRPVGLGFDSQGNLYISDDKQGLLYRLSLE